MPALLLGSQVAALNDPGAWIWTLREKQEKEGSATSLPGSHQGL